jgi:hypothetical protein
MRDKRAPEDRPAGGRTIEMQRSADGNAQAGESTGLPGTPMERGDTSMRAEREADDQAVERDE